jgi:hypothetical protein
LIDTPLLWLADRRLLVVCLSRICRGGIGSLQVHIPSSSTCHPVPLGDALVPSRRNYCLCASKRPHPARAVCDMGKQSAMASHSLLSPDGASDKNFASFFPILDILFGTACVPRPDEYPATGLVPAERLDIINSVIWLVRHLRHRDSKE